MMKYELISVMAGALALTGCISVTATDAKTATSYVAKDGLPTMKRPNLVVADMDRSMALYAELLGFDAGPVRESSADSFSYPVFKIPQAAKIRFVTMNDSQDTRAFALTEVTGVELPKLPDRPLMAAFVIGVDDLPGKIETVQELGLWTSPSKTVDGSEFTFIEQAFVDYDGHLIVLYEVLSE